MGDSRAWCCLPLFRHPAGPRAPAAACARSRGAVLAGHIGWHQRRHCFFSKPPCRPYRAAWPWRCSQTAPVMQRRLPLAAATNHETHRSRRCLVAALRLALAGVSLVVGLQARLLAADAGRAWIGPLARRSLRLPAPAERTQAVAAILPSWKARSAIALIQKGLRKG